MNSRAGFNPHLNGRDRSAAAGRYPRNGGLRIAIVAPSLDILGGQGIQARSLAQALSGDGATVLFIPVNPRFPRGLRWLRQIPVLRTLLNQCLYIAGLAKLRHADVVHVFSAAYWSFLLAPMPAIMAARLFGKRVILNYHSGEADDHLANWGSRVHPWLLRVDDIVVPSAYLQTVFAGHGYRAKVIHNIIDTSAFHFRQRHQLHPRLLSNRNLEPHYRVDVVLKAFALLKKQWPDAHMTVAGFGTEEARLRQWVKSERLSDVEFLGRVEPEAMSRLYDEADIFINASTIDNQPVSILEAFAAGLPVVSTPTGDIAHMLAGQRGTLVPTDDPAAMAATVTRLLNLPEQAVAMARRAREEVEKYSWAQVRPQWMAIYRDDADSEGADRAPADNRKIDGSGDEATAHLENETR